MALTGNEPANPQWDMTFEQNPNTDLFSAGTSSGLTIRQQFAAMAMQGILAKESCPERINREASQSLTKEIAQASVVMADALIAELNKEVK